MKREESLRWNGSAAFPFPLTHDIDGNEDWDFRLYI